MHVIRSKQRIRRPVYLVAAMTFLLKSSGDFLRALVSADAHWIRNRLTYTTLFDSGDSLTSASAFFSTAESPTGHSLQPLHPAEIRSAEKAAAPAAHHPSFPAEAM